LVILLAVASGLAALLGEVLDAVMISIVVALNVGLSFFQEWRAERALAAIAGLMTPHSTVIRSGRRQRISVRWSWLPAIWSRSDAATARPPI
jgi:Ca2+-transporting ATPase